MIGGTVCSVARLLRCKIEPVTNSSPCWKRFRCPTAAFRTWNDCQASRDRNAIYGYLSAVYDLVAWWSAEGREADRARRALRMQRLKVSDREEPFAAVIRCTADPAKADKRTRSKWSRVLGYAAAYKPDSEPLGQFIKRKGGINACAGRFSRSLGRLAALDCEAQANPRVRRLKSTQDPRPGKLRAFVRPRDP
jgi:hypothetical protein